MQQQNQEDFMMNMGQPYPGSDKTTKKLQEEVAELKSKLEYATNVFYFLLMPNYLI